MTLYPNLLKKGAVFGVWTPSSPAPFLFPIRYQRAISAIQKRGYSVIEGASCAKKHEFSPNFDRELAKDFHCLLTNPKVDAILFSTGGHSTISVLPHINWELIKQYPKPVIGYSDATVFLLAYYKMTQIISFHGPMVISEWGEYGGPWEYTVKHFEQVLFSRECIRLHPPDYWTDEQLRWDEEDTKRRLPKGKGKWRLIKTGKAIGKLIGGNLPTLSLLVGSPFFPDLTNCILFLEAHQLTPDHFYAYLMQLKLARKLDKICGLIIGRYAQPKPTSSGFQSFDQIVKIVFEHHQIPILVDVDIGHTEPMLTLPIGGLVKLDSENNDFSLLMDRGVFIENS